MKHNTISLTSGSPTPAVIEKEAGGLLGANTLPSASAKIGRPRDWNACEESQNRLRVWNYNAETSCQRHLEAMRLEFKTLALRHEITVADAQLLLMNSVQP